THARPNERGPARNPWARARPHAEETEARARNPHLTFMPTIHEQIDEFLAADLHGELSTAEQNALHAHLIECAQCRKDFQEEKHMHKLLNETMGDQKADLAFEQRMVARFRDRVPQRTGLIRLVANLMRFRAVQITAAAALLLALAQMGRLITGESLTPT